MASHQGATLQNYNNELVRALEHIREERDNIVEEITEEEVLRDTL